jgi:hypothetical protein
MARCRRARAAARVVLLCPDLGVTSDKHFVVLQQSKQRREAAMIGFLAGIVALLAMSGAVIVGASILYDPERSHM